MNQNRLANKQNEQGRFKRNHNSDLLKLDFYVHVATQNVLLPLNFYKEHIFEQVSLLALLTPFSVVCNYCKTSLHICDNDAEIAMQNKIYDKDDLFFWGGREYIYVTLDRQLSQTSIDS